MSSGMSNVMTFLGRDIVYWHKLIHILECHELTDLGKLAQALQTRSSHIKENLSDPIEPSDR